MEHSGQIVACMKILACPRSKTWQVTNTMGFLFWTTFCDQKQLPCKKFPNEWHA